MSATASREQAQSLARSNPERALAVARAITDPWYRCQALAWVARYAPGGIAEIAFRESAAAAAQGRDGYRRLAPLAWPIRATVERSRGSLAAEWLRRAASEIAEVEPLPSRAYALSLLWAASFPGGEHLRNPILRATLAHCPPDRSWRAERLYREMVAMLATESVSAADKLIAAMPEGKARTRIERRRAMGELGMPRAFFW